MDLNDDSLQKDIIPDSPLGDEFVYCMYIPGHFTHFHYRITTTIRVSDTGVYSVSLVVPTGNPSWFKLRYLEKN